MTQSETSGHLGFGSMLYFSLQAMTTLGMGDLMPVALWLRLLVGFQALTGFALVTASVSWIVVLYPALGRVRTLARLTSILATAEERTGVGVVSGDVEALLGTLALDVIRTRVDLIHFPILYYFHSESNRASLPESIPHLIRFATQGALPDNPQRVRFAASMLRAALEDLAKLLHEKFVLVSSNDPEAVFRAYAEHHLTHSARR